MKLPFNPSTFARDMKPRISGVNVTLDYYNIESSLHKVAVTCTDILGSVLYEKLCDDSASGDTDCQNTAKDYLQRALLHFGIYEHLIFLITRIGNDGVTVKKNNDETTIYKYQEDDLKNNLITTGWFWMNQLIRYLNEHKDKFPDWKDKTSLSDIPIDVSDFQRWVGISDEYFVVQAAWLIREVWEECVLSRQKEPVKTKEIARALCYDVVSRACIRLGYMMLPEPIRKDISNEMGKNHNAQADTYVRERVAKVYQVKAGTYWTAWDVELNKQHMKEQQVGKARPVLDRPQITQDDKFFFS
jgi:hypothetical protein